MFDDQDRQAQRAGDVRAASDAAWWAEFDEFGDDWAAAATVDEFDDDARVSHGVDDAEVAALVAVAEAEWAADAVLTAGVGSGASGGSGPGGADHGSGSAGVAAVLAAMEPGAALGAALAGIDPAGLSDFDVIDYVKAVERQRRHLDGVLATTLAELAHRPVFAQCADTGVIGETGVHGPEGHDFRSAAADELSPALMWTTGHATSQVESALDLADTLPATLAALRAGRIDAYRARVIREATINLPAAVRARLEADALTVAEMKTAPALRTFLRRRVIAADPDGAEQRRQRAAGHRRVERPVPHLDGMATMSVHGPTEDLAALWTALTEAARARKRDATASPDHPEAGIPLAALRFDVLADLAHTALDRGHLGCCAPGCNPANTPDTTRATRTTPPTGTTGTGATSGTTGSAGTDRDSPASSGGPPRRSRLVRQRLARRQGRQAQIIVRMRASTAAGLDNQPAELAGFGPITASAARRLAADATWRRLLTDPATGQLLDFGRTTYRPPQPLKDFVTARDGTCRFPTCSWPATRSDLDHEPAWNDGGHTSPDGMLSLHRRHHQDKTHHGHRIAQTSPGVYVWITATGHAYPMDPDAIDLVDPPHRHLDPPSDPDPEADPPPF